MKAWASGDLAWRRDVADEAALRRLAAAFAPAVAPPFVIYLRGDLGAGKTTFARAYVHALGFEGYVKSPSYGLLEIYEVGGRNVLHLDLYRIEDPEELEYLAIRDQYDERAVLLVEWPDRGGQALPAPDMVLDFGEKDALRFVLCTVCNERAAAAAARVLQTLC
jgi:tRNA threonylcarbamoyladenosine biosynthesis protein TsaE